MVNYVWARMWSWFSLAGEGWKHIFPGAEPSRTPNFPAPSHPRPRPLFQTGVSNPRVTLTNSKSEYYMASLYH